MRRKEEDEIREEGSDDEHGRGKIKNRRITPREEASEHKPTRNDPSLRNAHADAHAVPERKNKSRKDPGETKVPGGGGFFSG